MDCFVASPLFFELVRLRMTSSKSPRPKKMVKLDETTTPLTHLTTVVDPIPIKKRLSLGTTGSEKTGVKKLTLKVKRESSFSSFCSSCQEEEG